MKRKRQKNEKKSKIVDVEKEKLNIYEKGKTFL